MTATVSDVLDTLCPMHLVLSGAGEILHTGPTLAKLRPGHPAAPGPDAGPAEGPCSGLVGRDFWEVFVLSRPRSVTGTADLLARAGTRLHLSFRDPPCTRLKGVLVPGPAPATAILDLAFGIALDEALGDYSLTGADFAPTDLTVEMLYLIEAKSAAMAASRSLNTRLRAAMIAAEEQAFTDTLTGLKNRRAMDHVLDRWIAEKRPFALMHLDLDWFKAVNDTHGHAAGDHVLQEIARVMVRATRTDDTVARIGGDEFVILLDRMTDPAAIEALAARVIARMEAPIRHAGAVCRVSASAGTVLSSDYAHPDPARLLSDADTALYAAKRAGRGRHRLHRPRPVPGGGVTPARRSGDRTDARPPPRS